MYTRIMCSAMAAFAPIAKTGGHAAIVIISLAAVLSSAPLAAQTVVVYVNADSNASTPDGSTWALAYPFLQDGLSQAGFLIDNELAEEVHIWVAAGTYRPDQGSGVSPGTRAASFPLRNNVRVYGGFAGIESDLSERNWVINKTTLSGDLNEDDDFNASYNQNGQLILSFTNYSTDNSHHVVSAIGAQEPINRTAHLDGFVIEGGTGFAGTCSALGGGGLLVDHGTPTIRNCEFRRNRSHPNAEAGFGNANGGAVFISSAGPLEEQVLFENCVFIHNEGLKGGGAVYAAPYAPVVFIRCQFIENLCGEKTGGGALWTITDCDLVNCTIVKNQVTGLASPGGAAIYSQGGVVRIWNCLVAENHAFAEDSAGAFYFSNGNIEIISSTLANNIAENGVGGIEMAGGQLTVD